MSVFPAVAIAVAVAVCVLGVNILVALLYFALQCHVDSCYKGLR